MNHHFHQNGSGEHGRGWPENVGILALEIYFPSQYVDQTELEKFDGASEGKYTLGLGQTRMGFCSDREDVNSLCLTVLDRLVKKTGISYGDVGRLEVGTETLLDKSKSVKSVLMQVFEESGNSNVEGVDSTNACYGGTAALFNCVNWVESSSWDSRYAVAVCADIAIYASGNARPTGGAGAVAMLVGPNAPLVFERGLRASHVQHVYDFYKPEMMSEYPTVDGKLSIQCYLHALDKCYQLYCQKHASLHPGDQHISLNSFDALLFHSPFCKLVQKSLARLALNDYVNVPKDKRESKYPELASLPHFDDLSQTYFDRDIEKAMMDYSKTIFEKKTKPSLLLATNVGNMYTPSLYGGLISYLCEEQDPAGKRIALFSYGSGLVSSFYSMKINEGPALVKLLDGLSDVKPRLLGRAKVAPSDFDATMKLREETHHLAPHQPSATLDHLFPDTWYLVEVDSRHRRHYRKLTSSDANKNGHSQ